MKEKDLVTDYKEQQVVYYAEKEDNSIGPIQTGSYMSGHYLDEFFRIMGNLERSFYEKLQDQRISPVSLYMTLEELTLPELASRVRIPRWKVKRHLEMRHFKRIRVSLLQRYAEVFNIPVANFFQVIRTRQDGQWRMGYQAKTELAGRLTISQERTNNPLIVVTKPEEIQP